MRICETGLHNNLFRRIEMAEFPDLEDASCSICYDSNEFRVLQCGHAFCIDCLQILYDRNGGKIPCPMDRREDHRDPNSLLSPYEFQGPLFIPIESDERHRSMNQLIDAQIQHRLLTIIHLRNLASTLKSRESDCAIAKITGSVAGIAGSAMSLVGLGLRLTKGGKRVGVPLALAGAGIGVAGGVTTGVTCAVEDMLQRHDIQGVQKDLALDYFKAEQIKVLLMRAAQNPIFAKRWQVNSAQFVSAGNILPVVANLGVTTAAGVRAALGVGRAATTTGLHIAGLVLAATAIPFDIAQMVVSSIKVHKKEVSKVVKEILDLADNLEKELRIYLIEGGHLQFIYTNDGQWVYIIVFAEKLVQFKEKKADSFTLTDVERFGTIVESGEGEVPSEVQKKMYDEWYSLVDEMIARALQEQLNLQNE